MTETNHLRIPETACRNRWFPATSNKPENESPDRLTHG
jgi:hypothetical protein